MIEFNSFTDNLLWMSIRYCVGRNTISTQMHATEIAKEAYSVIPDEIKENYAKDIRNLVGSDIANQFLFKLFDTNDPDMFRTFLRKFNEDNNIVFNVKIQHIRDYEPSNTKDHNETVVLSQISKIDSLLNWYNLSNLLTKENHKEINGKKCFEYVYRKKNTSKFEYASVGCFVEEYIKNPLQAQFCCTEDNPYIL